MKLTMSILGAREVHDFIIFSSFLHFAWNKRIHGEQWTMMEMHLYHNCSLYVIGKEKE